MNIRSSWWAAVWLGDTEGLEQLKFPRLAPRAYPHYLSRPELRLSFGDEIQSEEFFPSSLAKHTDTASAGWMNQHTWGSYFEYFVWCVQTEERCISRRLVLEQKTNHWVIQPPTAGSFRRLCVARAEGHTPVNGGWLGWHTQSHSFLSQPSGLCTLGAFILGTPHSTRQEKLAPEQKEARMPPGLPEMRAMGLSHMLTTCRLRSPGRFS